MSDFTGPGRNSEMSMMRSSNRLRPELADQLALAGALDLEAAQGVGRADQPEGRLVVEGHLGPVVEVDRDAVDPLRPHATAWAMADCIRMPRTSSLSRPRVSTSSLSNWLIGKPSQLASTGVRSSRSRSDRTTPHGCSGDVPGQPVEPLDEVEQRSSSRGASSPLARSSGSSRDRVAGVAGPDVRERLGDRVDLHRRQAERGADVADRVAHPVGVHHRDAGDPVAAEALEDPLVDLGAPRRLHVDVDVGQLGPQR